MVKEDEKVDDFVASLKADIEGLEVRSKQLKKQVNIDNKASLSKLLRLQKKLIRKKRIACHPYFSAAMFVVPFFLVFWFFDYLALGVSGITDVKFLIKNISMMALALWVAKNIVQDFSNASQEMLLFKIHSLERNIKLTQANTNKEAS